VAAFLHGVNELCVAALLGFGNISLGAIQIGGCVCDHRAVSE